MGRGIFIVNNRRWKPLRFPYIRQSGADIKIKAGYTYVNGAWRQFWPPALPVSVILIGAAGGRGGDDVTPGNGANPGHRVAGTMGLSSSDNIILGVGGQGAPGSGGGIPSAPGGAGGYGGVRFDGSTYSGGIGGTAGPNGWSGGGGGGGGATFLEVNGDEILVAAGGGGGGGGGLNYVPPPPAPAPGGDSGPAPAPAIPDPGPPTPNPSPPAEPAAPEPAPEGDTGYQGGDGIGGTADSDSDSDGDDGGAGGDSGGDGGGCFIGTTKILMANGYLKDISLVRVGERLQSDHGSVTVISNRDRYGDVELISINGSVHYMTSNHAVLTDQGWAVYDLDLLRTTEPALYQQILADNNFEPLVPLRVGLKLAHWVNGVVEYRSIDTLDTIIQRNGHVYWLNVSGDNHYIANGVVVHNDS
jgi:hypothetical protein